MAKTNLFKHEIEYVGQDLVRPECVLTNAKGDVFVSDFRGGVTRIQKDGTQTFWGGEHSSVGVLQTNGFALLKDGSFLIAHLGTNTGGVFQVDRQSNIQPWLMEVDAKPLPPTNFVYLDHQGRIWITVSTRTQPRADAYRKSCDDVFIILVDDQGARIVADGLGYTNEVWVNPQGTELYVNATFTRELIKYDIAENSLVNRKVITRFGAGTFPDGLTMDTNGNLWVTSIVSNRVIQVTPDGEQTIYMEENDDDHLAWIEEAYQADTMGRPHLDGNPAQVLRNVSSLAFTDTGILMGCLLGKQVYAVKADVRGILPAHWNFD